MIKLSSLITGIKTSRGSELFFFIVITILFFLFWAIAIGGLIFTLTQLPLKEIALKLNTYGNFVLAVLTFSLVVITAFYAMITYRMLLHMGESRRAEIKPLLWIKIDKPEFKDGADYEGNSRYFSLSNIHIANYGKGAAVSIRIKYTIPYGWNDEFKRVEPICETHDDSDNIPVLLPPNDSFQDTLNILIPCYELDKYKQQFLKIKILYEDTERNLYKMSQIYNLFIFPLSNEKLGYFLTLNKEELVFIAFSDRRYVNDLDESVMPAKEDKSTIIYSRKSII
ncbi:MAG: hypothetical protein IIC75_09735 [Bacteroidetes bacterium]|nr:hypothetical protein [Bacteroidota bacterium]